MGRELDPQKKQRNLSIVRTGTFLLFLACLGFVYAMFELMSSSLF